MSRVKISAQALPVLVVMILTAACSPVEAQDVVTRDTTIDFTAEAAVEAWYNGETNRAIEIYEALLEQDPADTELRLNLLVLLREAGALGRARHIASGLSDSHRVEHLMTSVLAGAPTDDIAPTVTESEADGRTLFWSATAELLRGNDGKSEELLRQVITAEPHYPYAHIFKGILARNRRDWDAVVEHMTRALRQDSNLTMAFLPLAEARFARGETQVAYELIGRAAIALPWDATVRARRRAWEEELPELVAARRADVERRRVIAEPPTVAVTPVDRDEIPRVRIGLAEGLSSVYVKTGGSFRIVAVPDGLVFFSAQERLKVLQEILDDEPLTRGERGMILRVEYDAPAGTVVIRDTNSPEDEIMLRSAEPVRLVYEDPRNTTIVFDLAYGHGQFSAGREDRSYRGDMEFMPGLTLVNELNVEEYLYSVVPSEMPAGWPETALEVQAVAARSYTLHRRTRFHQRGFDLLSSVASAHYRGVTGEHPRTTAAVERTRGLVLADGRGTLDAVYSANSAGYTESSASVWGFATSLVAVSDPLLPPLEEPRSPAEVYRWILDRPESYSGNAAYASASAYRWSLLVPREDIEQRLSAAGASVGSVVRIMPGPRGVTGRVERVHVIGTEGETTVNRDAIRSRLGGLRSNLFVVSPQFESEWDGDHRKNGAPGEASIHGETSIHEGGYIHEGGAATLPQHFYFEGAGWGHGVGMCQTGAAGMAAAGYETADILAHYYPRNEQVVWY